jgi:hypothetical protein
MVRAILSVIVGYIVMFVLVVASLAVAFGVMGVDGAFRSASYSPSTTWLGIMFVSGLIAAIIAGAVCRLIAGSPTPPKILAGLVVVLGLVLAIPTLSRKAPAEPRPAQMSNMEAMSKAQTPAWVAFANPFVGAVGTVIGASLVRRKPAVAPRTRTIPA